RRKARRRKSPSSSRMGEQMANRIPIFKLDWKASEMFPTKAGPVAQPKSPARAKRANMAVPPRGIRLEARLKVPGHIMPTEKPHRLHATSASTGLGDRDASR